eukprot:1077056-Prymnesium_polylepis.1
MQSLGKATGDPPPPSTKRRPHPHTGGDKKSTPPAPPPRPLLYDAPIWWDAPPDVASVANRFDSAHVQLSARGRAMLERVHPPGGRSPRSTDDGFSRALDEIRYNKFFIPEKADIEIRTYEQRIARRKLKLKIETTFWATRKEQSESKSYYDTEETTTRMLQHDWDIAMNAHGLSKFIVNNDDCVEKWDAKATAVHPEVEDVAYVLWTHRYLLYSAFDYYALVGTSNDIFHIQSNAFMIFCGQCKLPEENSASIQRKHLDQLFLAVNAPDEKTQVTERFNAKRALNRQEWLQALVRIAVMKYVMPGEIIDVSDALHHFFVTDLMPRLEPEAQQDSNVFRKKYCYVEQIDRVVRKHEESLRNLFDVYAKSNDGIIADGVIRSTLMLSYEEWVDLLQGLCFYDAYFTRRHGALAFSWSRMRVSDETSYRSRIRLTHHSFEDFIECLIRVSTMKSLPTAEDVEAAGATDGGAFLLELMKTPVAYEDFLASHTQKWNEEMAMPSHVALEQLIWLIIRVVEAATSTGGKARAADGKLTKEETTDFFKMGGFALSTTDSSTDDGFKHGLMRIEELRAGY